MMFAPWEWGCVSVNIAITAALDCWKEEVFQSSTGMNIRTRVGARGQQRLRPEKEAVTEQEASHGTTQPH